MARRGVNEASEKRAVDLRKVILKPREYGNHTSMTSSAKERLRLGLVRFSIKWAYGLFGIKWFIK